MEKRIYQHVLRFEVTVEYVVDGIAKDPPAYERMLEEALDPRVRRMEEAIRTECIEAFKHDLHHPMTEWKVERA